jgi:2-dehydropantoate 2-reductase
MEPLLKSKQHLIFGAGLIGCYLGAVLTSRELDAQLVCRPGVKNKLANGLILTDYMDNQQQVTGLHCLNSEVLDEQINGLADIDFLWLTVKCTGVEQALLDMAALVKEQTVILCCQNGLGSDVLAKQAFPENKVLRVMVPFNVAEITPDHLHRGSEGAITIEQTSQTQNQVQQLVTSIDCQLLPAVATDDMSALLWAKLQLNLSNSVCALADIPVKAMLEQRNYRRVIALLMEELLQVADGLQIALPKLTVLSANKIPFILRLPNFIFSRLANKMLAVDPKVRTSMWWDLSQGKLTEINYLNGAVIKHGKDVNVLCPVNEKIVQLILQLTPDKRDAAKNRPPIGAEALLQLVTSL